MATRHIWKASLLIAFLLFAPAVAAEESSNAEDASEPEPTDGPCSILYVGLEEPYVDPHPECLPDITGIIP